MVARWVHDRIQRAEAPFVEVNCSSLRGELLASELFGHERGAFTGPSRTAADCSTPPTAEPSSRRDRRDGRRHPVAALNVLEEKRYRRLGDTRESAGDFRLVADPPPTSDEVDAGRFRHDLFFRLNVFEITLPPLRERGEDILELAARFAAEFRGGNDAITPEAERRLLGYAWPGNVRELRNVVERAAILARGGGPIDVDEPPALAGGPEPEPEEPTEEAAELPTFREAEKRFLESALRAHDGNVRATARSLGMSRTTLYRKIERYGLAASEAELSPGS